MSFFVAFNISKKLKPEYGHLYRPLNFEETDYLKKET